MKATFYFWAEDKVPLTQIGYLPFSNGTYIITSNNETISGGSEFYYEIFRAIDITKENEPEYLHFIYS